MNNSPNAQGAWWLLAAKNGLTAVRERTEPEWRL
jgi:hypothetical protein